MLIQLIQLIASLSILVLLHELGHFMPAKKFKTKVDKFYLFFDPWFSLFKFKKGETEYGIGWLPLGGYVKIAGMVDESMDKEQMQNEPQEWEFRSKPAWQRFIIMIGGIVMNIILGIVIFIGITFIWGESYMPIENIKNGIYAHEEAQKIGLQTGDKIIKVNGQEISEFGEIVSTKVLLSDQASYTIDRNGDILQINLPTDLLDRMTDEKGRPKSFIDPVRQFSIGMVAENSNAEKAGLQSGDIITELNGNPIQFYYQYKELAKENKNSTVDVTVDRNGMTEHLKVDIDSIGRMGFIAEPENLSAVRHFSFFESIPKGTAMAFNVLTGNVKAFGKMFSGDLSAKKSLQGPLGIMLIFPADFDWRMFWHLTGLISMVLAFMNFLPIPALDGGHIVFILYEMITGKQAPEKILERAQMVGMIILLTLFVFVTYNDILKIFF